MKLLSYESFSGLTFIHQLNNTTEEDLYKGVKHSHPQIEIFLLIKGEVTYTIYNKKTVIHENELLILNSYEYHSVAANSSMPYERMILQIRPDMLPTLNNISPLGGIIDVENYLRVLPARIVAESDITACMNRIHNLAMENTPYKDHLILSQAINLIVEIANSINKMKERNELEDFSDYAHPQVMACIQYINNNLSKKILIDDITKNVAMSKSRLQHLFKEVMGYSIAEYITKQKMLTANKLLSWGQYPSQIAESLGYEYYSTFHAAFKKFYGYSPTDVIKYNKRI